MIDDLWPVNTFKFQMGSEETCDLNIDPNSLNPVPEPFGKDPKSKKHSDIICETANITVRAVL